jgi:sugar/nucleoside kinase (ribokinase family)
VRVVCAGDAGVDRFLDDGVEQAGGIGLNVAVHARRILGPGDVVTLVSPLGDDAAADVVRQVVAREGLDARLPVLAGATAVQPIRRGPDGERVFPAYCEGVLGRYRVEGPAAEAIAAADVLATTAFGAALGFFESVMAVPTSALRAVDFTNANDIGDPVAFAERWVPQLDVGLFGLRVEDVALIDALEAIARRHARLLLVTLGPDGSLALGGPERRHCPAVAVDAALDTTGAGDAYTAAFLCSYARTRELESSMAAASARAAATLGRLGSF